MAAGIFNDWKLAQTNYTVKTGGYTMQRNFETSFVTQCAPVLAGLKVANLFRWVEPDASAMHPRLSGLCLPRKEPGRKPAAAGCAAVPAAGRLPPGRLAGVLGSSFPVPLLRSRVPARDWRFPWLSAGRCRWLCGKQGQKLYVLRLLEMLWRPRCSTKDV